MKRKSLTETHPELAKEAFGWDPSLISLGNDAKRAWKCSLGHIWEAQVFSRTRLKKDGSSSGCPICSNRVLLKGFNDLKSRFPVVALEAHGWDPENYLFGSNAKVEWKCELNHVWVAAINSRTWKHKTGCPVCAGKKIQVGFNDLKTIHPEIASEANGWDPTKFTAGSNKRVSWRCSNNHLWDASILNRTWHKTGCPVCTGRKVEVGENDFAFKYPNLAAEAYGWDPTKFRPGSNHLLPWKDSLGHIWNASIFERTKNNTGCPYCSNKKLLEGFNDLKTKFPELASQLVGQDPEKILPSSKKKVTWVCPNSHHWQASPQARVREVKGCPTCKSLAFLYPEIAAEALGWNPSEYFAAAMSVMKWQCKSGHEYLTSIRDRTYKGNGCHFCSGKRVLVGYNDLASAFPDISVEAYKWDPSTVTAGSNKLVDWKCSKDHVYKSRVTSRTSKLSGCPYCSNTRILKGFNDLATKFPQIANQANGWDPGAVLPGTHQNLLWTCEEGHSWKASGLSRTFQMTGCPTCAKFGFDPNKQSYLYFLNHPLWEMFQIGITNDQDARLASHQRLGWEVLEVRGPMDGHLTQEWETSILRMLRKHGADLANASIAGKFDGYSEAWSKSTFAASSIRELMDLTDAYEDLITAKKKSGKKQ